MRPNLLVVRSSDLERAERFYRELGVAFVRHAHGGPEHLCAESDGMVFEIHPVRSGQQSTASTRLGFAVADVGAVLARLQAVDAVVVQAPREGPWGLRAVVRDPDGHCVELLQIQAS
jgi:predicted enzyme related to lactoylglutathione lyase